MMWAAIEPIAADGTLVIEWWHINADNSGSLWVGADDRQKGVQWLHWRIE